MVHIFGKITAAMLLMVGSTFMKERKRKSQPDNIEKYWEESARFYESDASLKVLEQGVPLSAVEKRKLLGPGKKKLISV